MQGSGLRVIAVVGGGVAGWMAAAVLSRLLKPAYCRVVVVEHPHAPAPGGAEGTIPAFQRLHNLLGIDEADFVRNTNATFKLGAQFSDWTPGGNYFHTFCEFGGPIASVPFHHYWLKLRAEGDATDIGAYSMATVAAQLGRFAPTSADSNSPLSLFSYAYHFDADLYARYLRAYATKRGVESIDATVADAKLRSADWFIEHLVLTDGRRIDADFFLDCTGFPGLLAEKILKTGIEDWSHWLPCDRAVSAPAVLPDAIPAHTRITAEAAGWQWSMPLQDRMDRGVVYCSALLDDDAAAALVRSGAKSEPRFSQFVNGRPKKFWTRNCVSLPGGFVEPLEANMVHMVQTGILRLIATFPDRGGDPGDADEYNRLTILEHERVRDFLILHYCSAGRADTEFWRHCRGMPIPQTLRHKIALFRASARVNMLDEEHFPEQSWISLLLGHGVLPSSYDPLADVPPAEDLRHHMGRMRETIRAAALSMPAHAQFLARTVGA